MSDPWVIKPNSNRIKDTYLKGFLEVSGGSITINKTSTLRVIAHDTDEPVIEFKPEHFSVTAGSTFDISYSTLAALGALGVSFEQSSEFIAGKVKFITSADSAEDISINLTKIGNDDEHCRIEVYGPIHGHYGMLVDGDISFNDKLYVRGDSSLGGNLFVTKSAQFYNDVSINGNLYVDKDLSLNGSLYVTNNAFFNSNTRFSNPVSIQKDISSAFALDVNGITMLRNNLYVSSDVSFGGKLFVNSDASFNSKLFVSSDASFNQKLIVGNDVSLNSKLFVLGTSNLMGDVSMNSKLIVGSDVSFNSKLFVSSDVSFNSKLFVRSDVSFNSKLIVGNDVSFNSKLFVGSDVSFNSKLIVGNDVSFNSKLFVVGASNLVGDVSINSKLIVGSDVSFNSKLFVGSDVSFNSKLIVGSDVSFNGKLFVNSDASLNGNLAVLYDVSVNRNLFVSGRTNLRGDVSLNGNLQIVNKVGMGTVPSATYELDVLGQVRIKETVGSLASASGGSLVLEHADASGVSSIVFTSKNNSGSDYAYIQYQENVGGTSEKGLLTIGIENESGSDNTADRISLFSSGGSGFVGINTKNPLYHLDVSGITRLSNNLYVSSDVSLNSKLFVNSTSNLVGDVSMNSKLIVGSDVSFNSKLFVNRTSNLVGDVSMNSKLIVGSDVSFNSKLFVNSDASFNSKLIVGSDVSFNSKLFVGTTSNLVGDVSMNSKLIVGSDVSFNGKLFVNTTSNLVGDVSMNSKLIVGSDVSFNSKLFVNGQVRIQETVGSVASASTGSLVLQHADASGASSIVFRSTNDPNTDYAYIQYQENVGGPSEKGLLTIGIENNFGGGNSTDRISLFCASGNGFVGINTKDPLYHLDVSGITSVSSNLYVGSDVSFNSKLFVRSDVSFNSKLIVGSDASFNSKLFVGADVSFNSKLFVRLDASFNQKLFVGSDASFNSKLFVGADVSFNSKLFVRLDASFNQKLFVGSDASFNSKLFVGADASFNSNLYVGSDLSVNGNLYVTKRAAFASDVSINGTTRIFNSVSINKDISSAFALDVSGQIRVYEGGAGTVASSSGGSLTLEHGVAGGTSSLVFKTSNSSTTADYAYIQYTDICNNYITPTYKWDLSSGFIDFTNIPSTGLITSAMMNAFPTDASLAWSTNPNTSINTAPYCISFNQTNILPARYNSLSSSTISNSQNITFSCWIYPGLIQLANKYIIIASFDSTSATVAQLAIDGNSSLIVLGFNNNFNTQRLDGIKLSLATWYHIAFTYNTTLNRANFFVNGYSVDTSNGITPATSNFNKLNLGTGYNSSDKAAFVGLMNYVNVFNTDLSESDILALYKQPGYNTTDRGLMMIGVENETGYSNNDRIALWPGAGSGFVGINTKNPQSSLDVSGTLNINSGSTIGGKLFVGSDVSFNQKLFVGSDVSFNQKLFVNSDVSINGNVSTGNLFVNGVQITSGGGTVSLTGNVQVGSNNGFVSIDKPYFYADPSLVLYYDFDTSFNIGTKIKNIANSGSIYDLSFNRPSGSSTLGMIDTTTYKFGTASLKNINAGGVINTGLFVINPVPVNTIMSFSMWIKKTGSPPATNFDRIFEFSDGATVSENNTIALDISSSGIIVPILSNLAISCLTIRPPIMQYNICDGIWNNITWIITNSMSYIYINGSIKHYDNITSTFPLTPRTTSYIAYSVRTGSNYDFSGNIDDFRYYNGKALNYAEIYQLYNNNFYTLDICGGFLANGPSVIYETVGSRASANTGSLTLLHGDASGSSSIMFKSVNDPLEYGYIQYEENAVGSTGYHFGLLTLGIENDAGNGSNGDRISLFPSGGQGYVGVNTKTPQSTLDVSGQMRIYEGAGTVVSASGGSLTLEHGLAGGTSSIVFKASNSGTTNDYAYIQYTDNQFIPPTYKWDLSSSTGTFTNSTLYPSTGVYTSPIFVAPSDASFAWALFSSTPGAGKPVNFPGSNYCISFNQTNITQLGTSRINYAAAYIINSNNFSFSAWICPSIVNITGNYIVIASASDNVKYAFEIAIAPVGSLHFMFNGNSTTSKIFTDNELYINNWYHIACTYNDSTRSASIYINSVQKVSGTITDISSVFGYNTLHIGTRSGVDGTSTLNYGTGDAASKGFRGYMAFVNLFNTTLTSAEVSTLYNNPNYVSSSDAGLLTIGNENDITYLNNDRISLWPGAGSGFVGVNTKTPLYNLDVSGTLNANSDALIKGLTVGKGAGSEYSNTAFGVSALLNNITTNYAGSGHTAIGFNTLKYSNQNAFQNTAVGTSALQTNTSGYQNTAVGFNALLATTSGSTNTAVGSEALQYNTTEIYNTAIGYSAGSNGSNKGNYNTYLGSNTYNNFNYINSTAIGYNTGITASNQIKLGRDTEVVYVGDSLQLFKYSDNHHYIRTLISNNLILGVNNENIVSIGTDGIGIKGKLSLFDYNGNSYIRTSAGTSLNLGISPVSDIIVISSTGIVVNGIVTATSFNATSDYRTKENIMPLDGTFTVDDLNPVTYNLKSGGKQDIGFIAHEVQEFYPFLVTGEKDGSNNQSLNYNGFIGILTKEIKDLKVKVARQEAKISNQEAKALEQEDKISAQEEKALKQEDKISNQDTRIQILEKMMLDLINK